MVAAIVACAEEPGTEASRAAMEDAATELAFATELVFADELAVAATPPMRSTMTVVPFSRLESISPLNATTICDTSLLTVDASSGDVLAMPKCCAALMELSRLIDVAPWGAPL